MDRKFAELAQRASVRSPSVRSEVRLISLSFDPEHDTPEVLAQACADSRGYTAPLVIRSCIP